VAAPSLKQSSLHSLSYLSLSIDPGVASGFQHCLLRLKRLWIFTASESGRRKGLVALVSHTIFRLLGDGLFIDWTMFTLLSAERMHYQILRIANPARGRPSTFTVATTATVYCLGMGQNQLSRKRFGRRRGAHDGVYPDHVLADRSGGFIHAGCKSTIWTTWCAKEGRASPRKTSWQVEARPEALKAGEMHFAAGVRYGLYHDRPGNLADHWLCVGVLPRAKWTLGTDAKSRGICSQPP